MSGPTDAAEERAFCEPISTPAEIIYAGLSERVSGASSPGRLWLRLDSLSPLTARPHHGVLTHRQEQRVLLGRRIRDDREGPRDHRQWMERTFTRRNVARQLAIALTDELEPRSASGKLGRGAGRPALAQSGRPCPPLPALSRRFNDRVPEPFSGIYGALVYMPAYMETNEVTTLEDPLLLQHSILCSGGISPRHTETHRN